MREQYVNCVCESAVFCVEHILGFYIIQFALRTTNVCIIRCIIKIEEKERIYSRLVDISRCMKYSNPTFPDSLSKEAT